MKKSAKTSAQSNSKTQHTPRKNALSMPNPHLKPFILHAAIVLAISFSSYGIVDHVIQQQSNQALTQAGQQTATVINRQIDNWKIEASHLAELPTLKSLATVKAIVPAGGAVPASLSFSDQDLINRAQTSKGILEITHIGSQAKVSIVTELPAGGYLISERPFAPLARDLQQMTPSNLLITLTQKVGNEQPVDIFKSSNNTDASLTTIPLNVKGWQLNIGQIKAPMSLNPLENIPFLAALLSLIGGLLPLLVWMAVKPQFSHLKVQPVDSEEEQLRKLNVVAEELTPSPQIQPIIETTIKPEPKPISPPVQSTIPNTAPNIEVNELDIPDIASESTGPVVTQSSSLNLAPEFSLDSEALTDLEFIITKSIPKHIFRAYDIRGKVKDLTAQWMLPISRALGSELRNRGQLEVVVGYDARETSEEYARIMRDALAESGLHVIDIGQVPTPIMHYAARQYQGNGIMITASHSPAEYNGIKWITQRQSPLPEDIQNIYDRAEKRTFTEGKGKITQKSFTRDYLDEMLSDVILSDDVTVQIDGMNGVMGKPAMYAIETLGCHVTGIDIDPNGLYPHGNPDPCEPDRLSNLSTQVIQSSADIGFAFDGDGDRLVVVNHDGTVVTSDQLIAIFAIMVLESRPGTDIVYDVKCSRMVSQTITAHGGRPIMSRSGSTFIRHAVMSKRSEVSFGGEFSGHYFFNDGRGSATDDGLYAAMRLLEWLTQRGQTLSEVLQTLPPRIGTPDIYLPIDSDLPEKFFQELAIDAALVENATLTTIDGVRLDFHDGFGIIRASNTGAFVTLRFEADNAASVHHIRQVFYDLIAKQLPNLAASMPNPQLT
ncbi:phosphomannomutase/phosphoglucomutase [Aquirhabdus parva]|nr:phosphomannomutase/phosphoglucomutase [Aquirhabdus parva]